MSRYTRAEFEAAGIEPGECDWPIFPLAGRDPTPVWRPCPYHEGYIDGYEMGREAATRRLREALGRTEYLAHEMREGGL